MMDFDALLVYLRDQIDEKVAVRWLDDELKRYLNVEYRKLCNAIKQKRGGYYEKEGIINTVANAKIADLPADFSGALIGLMYGNTALIPRDRREFIYLKSDARSQPKYFDFMGGSKLWLYPVPDKIYPLDIIYEYLPSDMLSSTDFVSWITITPYILTNTVVPTVPNKYYYVCTKAGTSDILEPTWGIVVGGITTDGTAEWTCCEIPVMPCLPDGYEILIVDGAIISCKLKDYQSIEEMLIRYRALRNQMLQSIRPKQTFKNSRVSSI